MKPMGGGLLESASLAFKYLRQFPDILPLVGVQSTSEIEEIVAVMEGPPGFSAEEQVEMRRVTQELARAFAVAVITASPAHRASRSRWSCDCVATPSAST